MIKGLLPVRVLMIIITKWIYLRNIDHKKIPVSWYYTSASMIQNIVFFNVLWNIHVFETGCINAGFYGSNCDIHCPMNCKDNTCHIQNGTCFMCNPGWTGVYCDTSKTINLFLRFQVLRGNYDYFFPFSYMQPLH